MKATGRDIEEKELALSFKDGVWTILGDAAEVLMSKTRQTIYSALCFAGKPMKPAELAEVVGLKPDLVRQTLVRMLRDGTVKADTTDAMSRPNPDRCNEALPARGCHWSHSCRGGHSCRARSLLADRLGREGYAVTAVTPVTYKPYP